MNNSNKKVKIKKNNLTVKVTKLTHQYEKNIY